MAVEETVDPGLDASTATLLANIAEQGGPALHEMPVDTCRGVFLGLVQMLQGEILPIHKSENIEIPGPGGAIPARVYTPRDAGGDKLPALLLFHGGGWVIGDLDTHDNMSRYYANNADVVVINVGYRLAPEHKFPAGHDDCIAATEWVHANADSLGIDATKIAVGGDSAGGNLAAAVSQAVPDKVAFQLLMYPATDLNAGDYPSRDKFGGGEYFLSNEDMAWFGGLFMASPDDVNDVKASPIRASDLSGLPPAVTVTAGFDPLCDEGKAYADRLRAAGVQSEYRCYDGTIHGFLSFPGALDAGADGLAFLAERLKSALS
ncbi:MAG: alpha/beta hydrolase [Rhodospirillales bacterium]|nr:alpha/beta hydrolase [Rhodospirillales bacterium]